MMKPNRLLLTAILSIAALSEAVATDYIRYVSKSQGAYNNSGTSWSTAKMNVQDAINDIKDKIESGDRGYIFVDAGTYRPTQAISGSGSSSTLYMSIQIPAGISVYGGFAGNETGATAKEIIAKRETITTEIGIYMKNRTEFTGSLSSDAIFAWNDTKHRYNTSYFGNCYHVVWFANNGFTTDASGTKHYTALADTAVLDGVVIRDGYAYNSDINNIYHNAFGGGAYMVGNAIVRNCEVYHCEASRGGGGLYLDGGGLVENCYVHDCQSLGVNSTSGFGGGIAVEQSGLVTHCAIINNVGRSGGGLSFNYDASADATGMGQYALAASACLVAQNTSTVEAGGIYMNKGGLINGLTIVNNKTYGTGVTLNSIVTGRSGGIYVRDHARIYNSVLWGNQTSANNTNNLQYAATRSTSSNDLKPVMTYVAISRADYTDWSGTKKVGISKLSDKNENSGSTSSLEKYAMFTNAFDTCGHVSDQAGIALNSVNSYLNRCLWVPTSSSGLCYAGLQLLDINETASADISAGYITDDLLGNDFSPKCTLGSYTAKAETPLHANIGGTAVMFVDPDRSSGSTYSTPGISWDCPLDNLTDALTYFSQNGLTGTIYVKEGTLYTASRSAHGRLRGTTIPMVSGVSVIGGYDSSLTGTDTSLRNPVTNPTIISGKVTDGDYASNVAHLVTFDGVTGSVLDGFELRWGNAASTVNADYGQNGAGVLVQNGAEATLKNLTISDCTAAAGACIYVGDGQITCDNCIFRNSESTVASSVTSGGAIYVASGATAFLDHCDVIRNVGYAVVNQGSYTSTNSLYYSNMTTPVEDTNGKGDYALPAFLGTGQYDGSYNLFDVASASNAAALSLGKAVMDWTFSTTSTTYPRFVNCTKNAGVSEAGDVTYYGLAVDYTPSDMNPAVNAASTGGVAHVGSLSDGSWGYDMTTHNARDYGGLPDIGALENGATDANSATQPLYGTVIYVRDYRNADGTVDYVSGGNGMSWSTAINGNSAYSNTTGANLGVPVQDMSYMIKDYDFKSTDGWTTTHNYTTYIARYAIAEQYDCTFDVYQTVTGLPTGWYNLTCQAFYKNRQGDQNTVYPVLYAQSGGTTASKKVMYYTDEKEALDYMRLTTITQNFTGKVPHWDGGYPSNYGTAHLAFEYGLYKDNSVWIYVADGTLRVGIRKLNASSKDWTAFDNFQLMYYGENALNQQGTTGLQFAVDRAYETMKDGFVYRTVDTTEAFGNSGSSDGYPVTINHITFNETSEHPQVNVWVGAGEYTNPFGYQIRNNVKVYGGFPKTGNPGMNERHPQLTDGVPLSLANQGLNVADYETILQTNPSIEVRDEMRRSVSVLSHPYVCRVTDYDDHNRPRCRDIYYGCEWDGFTLRYGIKEGVVQRESGNGGRRNGGAGFSIYENAIIRNCVIRDNLLTTWTGTTREAIGRGGGAYCDGGTVINCYFRDNISDCKGAGNSMENYGAAMFMIWGTMYNTVIAHNGFLTDHDNCRGNGIFFESANFYNNTVVNNYGGNSAIGVYTASKDESHLTVYNSIIMANNKPLLWLMGGGTPCSFDHCYLQSEKNFAAGGYSNVQKTNCLENYNTSDYATINPFKLDYADALADYDYRITLKDESYNCVNAGTEELGYDYDGVTPVVLPDVDMDYTDRVQDCRVDIGAYEYNGAASITPDLTTEPGTAIYYVTENGFGTTQAFNQANAACAKKLQKVLDAAGRYKYENKGTRVIVKLAGVDATAVGYNENTCFKYYPCRTTEDGSDNVRVWSIMVPRGVEVWGGYTDNYVVTNVANGTVDVDRFTDDERSVMYHPTFLQTQYDNSDLNETVRGYHVVTFTDETFDVDGNVREGMTLSSAGVTDRAVLDGLFLVGGQADGESFGSAASMVNVNQYGGAAVVTDYAHVRNCIVKNNSATYGGALALMNKGLVSGCLIIDNEADYGGGIYVVEDGITLSDGTTNSTSHGSAAALDANMPHVYTTTIVKNTGNQQGGGLWFSNDAEEPNVRVNSTVLWQNDSPDQANVAGQTSPDMPTDANGISTFEWYPFAYSAVQNIRLSGTSNISVDIQNRQGNRFGIDSPTDSTVYNGKNIARDTTQVDYYGLTIFSALCRTGMPYSNYAKLVETEGLAERDYNKWSRDTIPAGTKQRTYVDIGARAYPSSSVVDTEHPFLRLFVAETQDVNMDAYQVMQDYSANASVDDDNYIYGLLGSSFAYPFHNLDDALAYISEVRSADIWKNRANNLPFEICIARGEYYPQRDMQGNYGYSLANTFLIPEGVTLMGGFDCNELYGQYWQPNPADSSAYGTVLSANAIRFSTDTLNHFAADAEFSDSVTIVQLPLDTMAYRRVLEDQNLNNILEPWEFQNQTNLSGNTVNLQNSGVYHVVSIIPYAPGVGQLPKPVSVNSDYVADGLSSRFIGQPVVIDGVHISDGYARDYVDGSLNDNGIYDYYRGAGLRGNGNWYCSDYQNGIDDDLYHQGLNSAVAYRDIPLYIRNSQFINNQAGYGAGIDVNLSTHIYDCLFAENKAISQSESVTWTVPSASAGDYGVTKTTTVDYPGNGGAVCFNNKLEVYNTIFSNNEAEDASADLDKTVTRATGSTLEPQSDSRLIYGGTGAALYGGYNSRMKVLNCDFVNNKACLYPAIFTLNPNVGLDQKSDATEADYNLVANNVFWGNAIHDDITSANPFAQQLCINFANSSSFDANGIYDTDLAKAPASQGELDSLYCEAVWFSAYEKGRGKTVANTADYRQMAYSPNEFIGKTIYSHWTANYATSGDSYATQNVNIALSSDNDALDGPNFCNPSTSAGYSGYNEAADWSRARLNNLTDNGSCFLQQAIVNNGAEGYSTYWTTDADGKYNGNGAYFEAYYLNEQNRRGMNLGNDIYMRSASTDENLPRVAADPAPSHNQTYIDLGVYEYPHCRLVASSEGDAVDILWVSTIEKPENGTPDGSTWETPTSDLQRAIETLLSSRNGHRKEIRLTDGSYAPIYTYGGHRTFCIDTEDVNESVVFPDWAYTNGQLKYSQSDIDKYFVRSLTIKGGYSKDLRDQYDTELYPSVIRSTERLDGTTGTWDYLFYVKDAMQRYGKGDDEGLGNGAMSSSTRTATTIPVQLDGITFVNNQALSGTHGTAVRYEDQAYTYQSEGTNYTVYASSPATANISISADEYAALSKDISADVHCTYWTDDTYTVQSSVATDYALYYRVVDNPAKFVMTKCRVMNSGTHYDNSTLTDRSSSAVYIGQYGGDALIYNSVFHSNWGNPLEAYNTRTINNTVALNKGRWILMNSGMLTTLIESESNDGTGEMLAAAMRNGQTATGSGADYNPRHSNIMNTVLWRNNPTDGDASVYGKQFALDGYVSDRDAASDSIFRRNAYTRFVNGAVVITEGTDYTDTAFVNNNWNTYLSLDNHNISTGPNFKNPILEATDWSEGGDIEQRDFSLRPSVRLVNKGDTTIYADQVFDLAWIPTTELDFLDQPRVIPQSIEVGAIEYPQPLLRVIYVDPTQTENRDGTGWGQTMNSENLQNAIDLAAIYSATNAPTSDDLNEAYVFVKGDNDTQFDGITLRSGVNIFGSIDPTNVTDSVRYTIDEETGEYLYPHLHEDVATVVNNRPGLVGPSTKRTVISSVTTGEKNTFSAEVPTRIDGVAISSVTENNPLGAVLSPVLDINPTSSVDGAIPAVAVSHILVADNNASGATNVNVANVNNALIYEVLFRDNAVASTNYVLNLGSTGYGVNLTVEGRTSDAAGNCRYDEAADNKQGSHLWYSIFNYAGHPADENTLSKFNYAVSDANLNYQLTEHSLNIDRCDSINPMTLDAATANLVQFINYATDVDLLANPRVLNTRSAKATIDVLDRGAFETWCVGNDTVGQTVFTNTDSLDYGGNYYPHEGSVVYLLENSNLIAEAHDLIPAYLLVKRGASLYGHGQSIKAAYVAVERNINAAGSIVALPYDMDYNYATDDSHGPATYSYDATTRVLTLTPDVRTTAYTYNGQTRASARYQIMSVNSPCWERIYDVDGATEACQGVFFTCSHDTVYRFTGKGTSMRDYIYNEHPLTDAEGNILSTAQLVTLTQHNNEPTDGSGALTAAEDMGWNCFGIPYLVSEYKPYEMAYDDDYNFTASAVEYKMQLPKELWLYYDGLQTLADSLPNSIWTKVDHKNYAGFYAVSSAKSNAADWHLATDVTPALWVGEGMFAQTASYTSEDLYFYLPIYGSKTAGAAAFRSLMRLYVGDAIEDEVNAAGALNGTLYDLQGRRIQSPTTRGIYVRDGKKVAL
ncbi:MAG: hypothetical protein E7070_03380 [Bacteroidales bacterium]|nr:hypothetical protein [Bacteroidales bacterium]